MSVYLVSRPCHDVHQIPNPQLHDRLSLNTPMPSGHRHARPQRKRHRHHHHFLHVVFSVYRRGSTKMTRTHYLTRHQQDRHGSPLRPYSLQIFRCCGEPVRTSLEGRDEGTAFSCWFGNGWVHDGQRPLRQHSRPRRNMLWPQGRVHMRIPKWLCRRCRRFLC